MASGFTASSQTLKTGDITFTTSGKGSYVEGKPADKIDFNSAITGGEDKDWKANGIQKEDGKYVIDKDITITMDGKAVFRFAVEALPHCLHTVLDETQRTLDDLSWVVCHQANSRIIDHCVKALRADPAKFYKNMDRHGNTSAASIPVALIERAESGQLKPGQLLACIGFGGGLTWGGAIFQYKECV